MRMDIPLPPIAAEPPRAYSAKHISAEMLLALLEFDMF